MRCVSCPALGSLAQGCPSAWRCSWELVPPCPTPPDPWVLIPTGLDVLCSALQSSVAASEGRVQVALSFWLGCWRPGLDFPICETGRLSWLQHLEYHQCLYYKQQESPTVCGKSKVMGGSMVAGTWRLASGYGRPACGPRAHTSVELSSLTPAGFFPLPTAFSSESPS